MQQGSYVTVPKEFDADVAFVCEGDGMINARIFDGDIVLIRRQNSVEDNEIAAVMTPDGAVMLKRVRLFGDHISLESENPCYPPLVYWGEAMETIRILGKAIAFISKVR